MKHMRVLAVPPKVTVISISLEKMERKVLEKKKIFFIEILLKVTLQRKILYFRDVSDMR